MPEPRKPVMTVAGTRLSSACASKAASERCRWNTVGGGRGRGGPRLRKHLEKEWRGRWRRAEEEAAALVALGSSSRAAAAAAAIPELSGELGGRRGLFWGFDEAKNTYLT